MDTLNQYDVRNQHPEVRQQSQGARWSRLSLRFLAIVCNSANIGFAAYYYTNWTIGLLIMMGPPAILSVLWSVVDLIFLSWRQGVHPAACLGVDGLIFFALAAISGVLAFMLSKLSDSGWYFSFFRDEQGVEYIRIVLGFGIVTALIHLTTVFTAIYQLRRSRQVSKQGVYATGQWDGSFDGGCRRRFGEAPPAYSGPTNTTAYQPDDQISSVEPAYELPTKNGK